MIRSLTVEGYSFTKTHSAHRAQTIIPTVFSIYQFYTTWTAPASSGYCMKNYKYKIALGITSYFAIGIYQNQLRISRKEKKGCEKQEWLKYFTKEHIAYALNVNPSDIAIEHEVGSCIMIKFNADRYDLDPISEKLIAESMAYCCNHDLNENGIKTTHQFNFIRIDIEYFEAFVNFIKKSEGHQKEMTELK